MSKIVKPIPFDKGAWPGSYTPDGYATTIYNLIFSQSGTLVKRGSFQTLAAYYGITRPASTSGGTAAEFAPGPLIAPDYLDDHSRRAFRFTQPNDMAQANLVGLYASVVDYPGNVRTPKGYMVNGIPNTSQFGYTWGGVAAGGNVEFYSGMCQYRDRIYMVHTNTFSIKRFTATGMASFSGGGNKYVGTTSNPALTNIFTGGGTFANDVLVTINDRLFANNKQNGKVYFTEIAAVGGYPENWNGGNNVIDFSSDYGAVSIFNMIPLGDRLYIFTDVGIFVLFCAGPTANWSKKLVTGDLKVFSRHGVCQVGQTFIVTDRRQLWAFNGVDYTEIGLEMREVMAANNSVCVFPFLDGFILKTAQFTSTFVDDGAGHYFVKWNPPNSILHNYFDGKRWVTIEKPGGHEITASFTGVTIKTDGLSPNFTAVCWDGTGWMRYVRNDYQGDQDFTVAPYTDKLYLNMAFTTSRISTPTQEIKHMDHFNIDLYNPTGSFVSVSANTGKTTPPVDQTLEPLSGLDNEQAVFKAVLNRYARTAWLEVSAGWDTQSWTFPNPPFEIRAVELQYENIRPSTTEALE